MDEALVAARAGEYKRAVQILDDALNSLPPEASVDGDGHWDALQRFASEICRYVEQRKSGNEACEARVQSGRPSDPGLVTVAATPGQPVRSALTRLATIQLAAALGDRRARATSIAIALSASPNPYVRAEAAATLLTLSLAAGAGAGFVESIIKFEVETKWLFARGSKGDALTATDDGPQIQGPPEWHAAFLVIGLVCAQRDLRANVELWLSEARELTGDDSAITRAIKTMRDGIALSFHDATLVQRHFIRDSAKRLGAAAFLLIDANVTARFACVLQLFIADILRGGVTFAHQSIWNHTVASAFARFWRERAASPFQFIRPKATVPELKRTIADLEAGRGAYDNCSPLPPQPPVARCRLARPSCADAVSERSQLSGSLIGTLRV